MSSLPHLRMEAIAPYARWCLAAMIAAGPLVAAAQSAPAVSTLAAFSGSQVYNTPVRGTDGVLYGITAVTSLVSSGLIYRLEADGSGIRTIYQIRNDQGYTPVGGLLLGSDNLLYGTTAVGSLNEFNTGGTVFRVATDGTDYTILHKFESYTTTTVDDVTYTVNSEGVGPGTELMEGSDGFLYGVTPGGGSNGTGVVFKLARDGSQFTVLHAFGAVTDEVDANGSVAGSDPSVPPVNADGIGAVATLLQGSDGYLYGAAPGGGATGAGTLFRLRFDGTGFEVLHTFPALVTSDTSPATNADGANPVAGLIDGGDGRLYGVAQSGGSTGRGTVFAFDPLGRVYSVQHTFDGTDGWQPTGELLLGQDGDLYGTTAGGGSGFTSTDSGFGTIFRMARDGSGFTSLFSFDSKNGRIPSGRLLQSDATTFIGLTQSGGQCGSGSVFQFSLTGATVSGVTNCGRKKNNNSGGGGTAPALLLLLATAALARRWQAS